MFDINSYLTAEALEGACSAVLPLLPQDGIKHYQGCHIDDDYLHYRKLTFLHLLGYVIAYGPIPAGLSLMEVSVPNASTGKLEPAIHASCEPGDFVGMHWLQGFATGLDSWNEALFQEPTATFPAEDGSREATVSIATVRCMLDFAKSRIELHNDARKLANLVAVLNDLRVSALVPS